MIDKKARIAQNEMTPSIREVQDASVRSHTAIVAEGGGQRGIYTAGVLDKFLCSGFNPFEIGVGSSAGAQNLFTYFLDLPGFAKRAIAELTAASSFLVPYRWLGGRSILDLDTYFSQMLHGSGYRLPYQRISSVCERRQLIFVATKKSTLSAAYLEPECHNAISYMKASSAVPFLYKEGVPVGEDVLVDGSVADPIPVKKAYEQGARRILVIRTVPKNYTRSCWRQRIDALKLSKALPGNLAQMLERHESAYNEAIKFMRNPPKGIEIVEMAPDAPLQSSIFGSRYKALVADYETGCRAGDSILKNLYQWQSQLQPLAQAA